MVLVLSCMAQGPSLFAQENISEFEEKANLAYGLDELDSAAFYYRLAINEHRSRENHKEYIKVSNYLNYVYYELDLIDSIELSVVDIFAEAQKHLASDHPDYFISLSQLSSYHFTKCNFEQAKKLSQELIQAKKAANISEKDLARDYLNLGNIFEQMGDQNNGLKYFRLAQNLQDEQNLDETIRYRILQSIAHIYRDQEKFAKASELYLKCLEIAKKSELTYSIHSSYLWVAEIEALRNNYNQAFQNIQLAEELQIKDPIEVVRRLEALEFVYSLQGNNKEALSSMLNAQELAEESNTRMIVSLQVHRFLKIAESYNALGDFEQALNSIQNGLAIYNKGEIKSDDGRDYPNPSIEEFYNSLDGFRLTSYKSELLFNRYQKEGNIKFLEEAFKTGLLAIELNGQVRNNIVSDDAKIDLSSKGKLVFQNTFEIGYLLFESTKDEKFKEQLFQIAEGSKANLLLEDYLYKMANQNHIIPDSIISKERNLQHQINYLKKEIFLSEGNNKKLKKLQNQMSNLNVEFDLLINNLEDTYLQYYQTKYETKPASISSIQSHLTKENKSMILYFEGLEDFYGLSLSSAGLSVQRLDSNENINSAIDSLQKVLSHESQLTANEEFTHFTSAGLRLYNYLLSPFIVDDKNKSLIVIPDGKLSYIPFEVLISAPPTHVGFSLNQLDYVLEDHAISYDYSASFYALNIQKKRTEDALSFVGFAPSFENTISTIGTSEKLSNLNCNKEEVKAIATLSDGIAYTGSEANSDRLINEINNHQVVHLATHTYIDPSDAQNHQVYFSDKALSSFEIENMRLNNDIVVLSACNTGRGKLIEGEGVFSLARGFLNAGCKSVLMSLWAVNDCSTSDLMQLFYKNLKLGYAKDESLRLAKVEYLKNAPKMKQHPSLWSPFLAYGNMNQLSFKENNNLSLFAIPVVLFIALYLSIKMIRKRKDG